MGFSCLDNERTIAKIWVLEDYEREVWSLKYHIKFLVESLYNRVNMQHLVLSHKRDMLVYYYRKGYMFHCDSTGKLLEEFQCNRNSLSNIGHCWFKESLIEHNFLRRGSNYAGQIPCFQRV
jgi:hypothetical protein